jgi:hypothetical protein
MTTEGVPVLTAVADTENKRSKMTTEGVPVLTAVVDTESVETGAEIKESRYGRWSLTVQDYVSVDLP